MSEIVSKELVNEVLGYKVKDIKFDKNAIKYKALNGVKWERIFRSINIHELAHKCKEWIANRYPRFSIKWDIGYVKNSNETVKVWLYNKCIGEDRQEYKAIFKACQWILENEIRDENIS